MKKFNLIVALLMALMLGVCLVACGEWGIKFTVTFDTQGGSEIAPITVGMDETIVLPENPTKDGYIFDGWYIDRDLLNEFIETQTIAENITLYAKWACVHTPITDVAVDADCENTGLTEGSHCSKCNDVLVEQQIVLAKGHNYGKWIDEVSADCENTGTKGHYECSVCHKNFDAEYSEIRDVIIPANGHEYGAWISEVPTTCTKTGVKGHYECSACHKYFDADYNEISDLTIPVDPNAHKYGEWTNKIEQTCLKTGQHGYYTCSECLKHYDANGNRIDDLTIECHHYNEDEVCKDCGYFETGLEFALNDDGESWSVVGIGTFNGTELKIPSVNYDTKPVTSINEKAFFNNSTIEEVEIGKNITKIGHQSFSSCSNLKKVSIGSDVSNIVSTAFYGSAVDLSLDADNRYFIMQNGVLYNLDKTRIYFVNSDVAEIAIPSSVTHIGGDAFNKCAKIKEITIPDSVVWMGECVFGSCTSLENVVMSNKITDINWGSFSGCVSLKNITLPKELEYIGSGAFKDCVALTTISIPNTVTKISDRAFERCSKLASITIPSNVASIGRSVFNYCVSLESIVVDTGNSIYHSEGNCLIQTSDKVLVRGCKNSVIPSDGSVTSIGEDAFYGCKGLTNIVVPDCVTSIGDYAFFGSDNLTSIAMGNSVTDIGNYAFFGCRELKSITIHSNMTSIGAEAFAFCDSLESIVFEDTIGWYCVESEIDWNNKTGGTAVDVSDATANVEYFKSTYYNCYWYKSEE